MPLKFCVDNRIAGCPRYYFGDGSSLMFVPEVIRECVAFIGYNSKKSGGQFRLAGTVFFIRMSLVDEYVEAYYVVTAKHIITKIGDESTDGLARLQVNTQESPHRIIIDTKCSEWVFHPTDSTIDIAILSMPQHDDILDHRFLSAAAFVNPDYLRNTAA